MTSQPCALIIEDEYAIRRFLRTSLEANGYQTLEAECGQAGLTAVIEHRPDLVLLDLGLPDLDGLEVLRQLRTWSNTPILILSVRERTTEKIEALDAGADDYLTKPFDMEELLARVRAAMRRLGSSEKDGLLQTGGLQMDLAQRLVLVDGQEVQLTPTEYDLLKALFLQAGKVLTHTQLLKEVWGLRSHEFHLIRVNVSNLRRKIEKEPVRPRYLLTEPGVGYRLRLLAPAESASEKGAGASQLG